MEHASQCWLRSTAGGGHEGGCQHGAAGAEQQAAAAGSGAMPSNKRPSAHGQQSNGGEASVNGKQRLGVANGGMKKPNKGKKTKKLSAKQQQSVRACSGLGGQG